MLSIYTPENQQKWKSPRKLAVWGPDVQVPAVTFPVQLCFRSTAESRREVASDDEEDFEERVPGQDVGFQNLGLFGGSTQLHLGGGFKYFLCSSLLGEMIPILTNIFQMGWNHLAGS